jgi:hypothetical protein
MKNDKPVDLSILSLSFTGLSLNFPGFCFLIFFLNFQKIKPSLLIFVDFHENQSVFIDIVIHGADIV